MLYKVNMTEAETGLDRNLENINMWLQIKKEVVDIRRKQVMVLGSISSKNLVITQ